MCVHTRVHVCELGIEPKLHALYFLSFVPILQVLCYLQVYQGRGLFVMFLISFPEQVFFTLKGSYLPVFL